MPKTALIVGHSSGLGAAVTAHLLEQNYEVIGVSRSDNSDGIATIKCDLSDSAQITELIETIKRDHSQFDALIWAAGTLTAHAIGNIAYDNLEYSYKVNTFAPMAVESALLDLIRTNEADVINITSSSVIDYYPQYAEYSSSKAAFVKFTQDLWKELRETKCRVTEFCPSGFASNIYKVMSGDKIDRDESIQMDPNDIARIIAFILDLPKKVEIANIFVNRK